MAVCVCWPKMNCISNVRWRMVVLVVVVLGEQFVCVLINQLRTVVLLQIRPSLTVVFGHGHIICGAFFTSTARQCRKPTTHAHTNISRERARARIRSMWPCAADVTTPPHSHACARACVRSRACTRSFPPLPPGGQGKTDFLSMCT